MVSRWLNALLLIIELIFTGLNKVNNSTKLIELYGKTLKVIVDGEFKDILFERSGREDSSTLWKTDIKQSLKKIILK